MSNFVVVHHVVSYFPHWKSIFDVEKKKAEAYGLKPLYVLRDETNHNKTTIILEAEDLDRAKEFMTSIELKETMNKAGVIQKPEIWYLSDAMDAL